MYRYKMKYELIKNVLITFSNKCKTFVIVEIFVVIFLIKIEIIIK